MDRNIRLIIVNSCARLKNECSGLVYVTVTTCIIHPKLSRTALHTELGTHLGNIGFLDETAWAQTLAQKLDSCEDSVRNK
jgi:hypothetical protein